MKYEVTYSAEEGIVRTTVYEPITTDLAKEFVSEAIRLAQQEDTRLHLVDMRGAPNVSTTFEQYSFGYEKLEELGASRVSRQAILISPNDSSHDFAHLVTQNAGYTSRIFQDEEEALSWLKG